MCGMSKVRWCEKSEGAKDLVKYSLASFFFSEQNSLSFSFWLLHRSKNNWWLIQAPYGKNKQTNKAKKKKKKKKQANKQTQQNKTKKSKCSYQKKMYRRVSRYT